MIAIGRPHKFRKISKFNPRSSFFRPMGIAESAMSKIFLTADELEAMKLKHYEKLKQVEAAQRMHISQTTYSRILNRAYEKVTRALIEGHAIAIQKPPQNWIQKNREEEGADKAANHFYGYGCLECGYEWPIGNYEFSKKPPPCPECQSSRTYRIIKKIRPE